MFVFCHQWEMMVEAASCLDLPEAVNYPFAEEGGGIGRMWNTLFSRTVCRKICYPCVRSGLPGGCKECHGW